MPMLPCDSTDLYFPMLADVYYPNIIQGKYGEIKKEWSFDRTIALHAEPYSRKGMGEISPAVFLQYKDLLIARTRYDIRLPSYSGSVSEALTNIMITNIRNTTGQQLHLETAGPRSGNGTLYEIASYDAHYAPYGNIDYYAFSLRRSENQVLTLA